MVWWKLLINGYRFVVVVVVLVVNVDIRDCWAYCYWKFYYFFVNVNVNDGDVNVFVVCLFIIIGLFYFFTHDFYNNSLFLIFLCLLFYDFMLLNNCWYSIYLFYYNLRSYYFILNSSNSYSYVSISLLWFSICYSINIFGYFILWWSCY